MGLAAGATQRWDKLRAITLVMLLSFAAACTTEGSGRRDAATASNQPRPATSEYLATQGGGMLLDPGSGEGKFMLALSLRWVKVPPPGAVVRAEFENKAQPTSPHRIEVAVDVARRDLVLKSPPHSCVVGQSQYKVVIHVFADESKKVLLGTHEQVVAFPVSTSQIQQLGARACAA